MHVQIVVDPALGLDAASLVQAWNEDAERRRLAEARLERQPPADFPLDPELVENGLILLAGALSPLALEAAKTAVSEWVKELLKRRREKQAAGEPKITVQAVPQPGGAVLLVVTEEER